MNSGTRRGLIVREVCEPAQTGRNILVFGSGELAQTLIRHDLVEEYSLMIHPVVLGSGKRLFREASDKSELELVVSRTTGSWVLILTYRPARRE